MRFFRCLSAAAVFVGLSLPAWSATFTPTFDTPSFPGTQFDVESDPSYNDFYEENFGITISNAYLYVDIRDTFDGIGIANGLRGRVGQPDEVARIDFLDTTDFVDLAYTTIFGGGSYSAYAADGSLLDTFSTGPGTFNGTTRLAGGIISYILFAGDGGTIGVSGLTYNYDGVTDGVNTDIGVAPVPLPASGVLLLGSLFIGGFASRRGRSKES